MVLAVGSPTRDRVVVFDATGEGKTGGDPTETAGRGRGFTMAIVSPAHDVGVDFESAAKVSTRSYGRKVVRGRCGLAVVGGVGATPTRSRAPQLETAGVSCASTDGFKLAGRCLALIKTIMTPTDLAGDLTAAFPPWAFRPVVSEARLRQIRRGSAECRAEEALAASN